MPASLSHTRKSPAEVVAALSGGRGKVRCLICMGKCHGGEGEAAGSGAKPLPGEEVKAAQRRLMNCFGD